MKLIEFKDAVVGDTVIIEVSIFGKKLKLGGRYAITEVGVSWVSDDEDEDGDYEMPSIKINNTWINEETQDCVSVFS